MKNIFYIIFLFSFLYSNDYSSKGFLVEESRKHILPSYHSSSMPKIVEEERTYGLIQNQNSNNINENDFYRLYIQNGSPKILILIDDKLSGDIGVNTIARNYINDIKIIKEYQNDSLMKKDIKYKFKKSIEHYLSNNFINKKINLVDRSLILRIVESETYKKEKGIDFDYKKFFLSYEMLNNTVEMDALNRYVDYVIEISIDSYKTKYPLLHCKVISVQDGSIVSSIVSSNSVDFNRKSISFEQYINNFSNQIFDSLIAYWK
jgi:hypothetical protein